MITSALASAQSAFSLRCAAESGIKTIVQIGSALGVVTVPRSYPERSLRPFQKSLLEKHIEFCARPLLAPPAAKYWPVKFGDPDEKAHPVVNALSNACMQAARMQNPGRRLDMDEGRRRAWRRSNKYLCAPSKSIIRTIQTSSNNYFFKRRD